MAVITALTLSCAAFASAVEADPSLVRREASLHTNFGKTRVHFGATGEVLLADEEASAQGAGPPDVCHLDFVMGEIDTSNCSAEADDHKLILNEKVCEEAARLSGATAPHGNGTGLHPFMIPPDWYDERPKGCFFFDCDESPDHTCYFYNGIGDDSPAEQHGWPVCQRPHYKNGTKNTNDECPEGYEVISTEAACSQAATCLGYCKQGQFMRTMSNASEYNQFPRGCFIHEGGKDYMERMTEGCVYFNPPRDLPPLSPGGINLCSVKEKVHWPQYVEQLETLNPVPSWWNR